MKDMDAPGKGHKVGIHTGDDEKLTSRYITSIPNLKILYIIKIDSAKDIEYEFKELFKSMRLHNKRGNLSEWIPEIPADLILKFLIFIIINDWCKDIVNVFEHFYNENIINGIYIILRSEHRISRNRGITIINFNKNSK